LLGNHSFIDFWSCHLRASSLASEVHDQIHERKRARDIKGQEKEKKEKEEDG
jgi:hypothetical protein